MTVSDPRTIDAVTRSAGGLLVLAVTEDRPYTAEDGERLAGELWAKLDAYGQALRSGRVPERRGDEPVAVVLAPATEPPDAVREVLAAAGRALADAGVTVTWRPPTRPGRDTEAVLRDLGAALLAAAPEGATRLRYRAVVAGPVRRDVLTADGTPGERSREVAVPAAVRVAVEELKRVMWTPERGTWLETDVVLDRAARRLLPLFNHDLEPAGPPLPAEALVAELRSCPRPAGAVPGWVAARIG
ncbi:hypothetical protein SAMN05660464_4497 [Geodermatophilus dictyosporus]|uniref:Uncharacterized protein n=1 Tax=Geodermatophilus dictyosporus TaxID=1523247 RepID=A0A1I5TTC3_9ACTN|nr:hypothetical protein [Geodermatophilus dictyosporus]SFP86151.1 hypothetical protein SAMN05660464_4497 [Geodermatophilus dictyosporus]